MFVLIKKKFDFFFSYYKTICGTTGNPFPLLSIWCVKAPKRASFTLWTVAWGKILTIDNLIKKGLSLVGWYCLCQC